MSVLKDLNKFPVFTIKLNKLVKIETPEWWDNYNYNMHHYIRAQEYDRDPSWFLERNIKQKLILIPVKMHEHLHDTGIKILDDAAFFRVYRIKKSRLLFNRKKWIAEQVRKEHEANDR